MKNKIIEILVCILVIFYTFSMVAISKSTDANTIYVDDDGGSGIDFTKIQDAINAASNDDTIIVNNGTYYENIVINKTINLIGEGRENTFIDGREINEVIYIEKNINNVRILGFTIQNSSNNGAGIEIDTDNTNIIVTANIITDCGDGIQLNSDTYLNVLSDNIIIGNKNYGIYGGFSIGNTITSNDIINNDYGIYFDDTSTDNEIAWNEINYNTYDGISLKYNSHSSGIVRNNITNNGRYGIYLEQSSSARIRYNNFIDNGKHVLFKNCLNLWRNNYWSPRGQLTAFLPYIIWGMMGPIGFEIPFPQIDPTTSKTANSIP